MHPKPSRRVPGLNLTIPLDNPPISLGAIHMAKAVCSFGLSKSQDIGFLSADTAPGKLWILIGTCTVRSLVVRFGTPYL